MPKNSKQPAKKKKLPANTRAITRQEPGPPQEVQPPQHKGLRARFAALWRKASARRAAFLARRQHRSFQRTRRRDYVRTLALPGYISFSNSVFKTVWLYKKPLLTLLAIYVALYAVLVGLVSQDTYTTLTDSLKEVGADIWSGNWGAVGTAAIVLVSLASPEAASASGESAQIFAGLLYVMMWLSIIWYLRSRMAGHRVKVRDALYNSGAPLFATLIVVAFLAVQVLPIVLAIIGYTAASSSGLLNSGVAAMLCWAALGGLALLSLYWIVSSFFALVIVTLPGTYPYKALKVAGDVVLGRRFRLVLRWSFMILVIVLVWVLVMVPLIALDMWLGSVWGWFKSVPLIPVMMLVMSALTIIWSTTYIYLLYRKVVESAAE